MDTNRGKQKDSIEDAGAVSLFRSRLAEKNLLPKSQDNYLAMLRFLNATRSAGRYDYDKAIFCWEKMINWRKRNGVDTIIQDFVYKEQEDARLCYPQGFHGVDKAGRPIFIKYTNKIDCAELMKVTTVDRFVKYYIQECEKMVVEKFPACSEIAKKPIDSMVYICILPPSYYEGFKAFLSTNMLGTRLAKIHFYNYPETVHLIFYINAGIITKVLNKLKIWGRDPKTRPVGSYALGKDFRTKLLEFIDEDQLPTLLGGSCSCPGKEGGCLRFEKGPWEVAQAKDKNAEMILNERKEIAETVQIIPSSLAETIQTNLQPRNGLGSAVSPEAACHKCTDLENKVDLLSSKLEKLQTTLNLLLPAQDRASCSGFAREMSRRQSNDSEKLLSAEERANFAELQGRKLKKP